MKKVNLLIFSLSILFLMSCGGAETTGDDAAGDTTPKVELSENEQIAEKFCSCNKGIGAIIEERREERMDGDTYAKKLEEIDNCFDPDGKIKAKEEAMTDEERKAFDGVFTALVKERCPDLAKEFGME